MKKLFSGCLLIFFLFSLIACKQQEDLNSTADKLCSITFSAYNGSSDSNSRQIGNYIQDFEWDDINKIVIRYTDRFFIVRELKTWTTDSNKSAKAKMESDTNITLAAGTYTFNIEMYDQENLVASGVILDKEIVNGKNHLAFSVNLDNEGDTAPITLNFSWEYSRNNLSKAVFGLYYLNNQDKLVEGFQKVELPIINNSASFTKEDFPCGNYIVRFDLYGASDEHPLSFVDLLITNKKQTVINIPLGNIESFNSVTYKEIENIVFADSSYTLPRAKNDLELLSLPVCNDVESTDSNKILVGWYDESAPETVYTAIPKNITKDLVLHPKWQQKSNAEVYLSVAELSDYLSNGSYSSTVVINITDKSPSLSEIKTIINNNKKSVNLSLKYCNKLRIIDDSFKSCTYITSFIIPDSINIVRDDAFSGCTNLTTVSFQNAITELGTAVFYKCQSLNSDIKLPANITSYPDNFFGYCGFSSITIPSQIETIGNDCFANCTSLKTVQVPASVKKIGTKAFYNSGIDSIDLSQTTAFIESEAFRGCTSLKTVKLPASLTELSEKLFYGCSSLDAEFVLPDTITKIGKKVFTSSSVQTINLPNSLTTIGEYAFAAEPNTYIGEKSNIKNITIPNSITTIEEGAFQNCKILEQIVIPDSVSEIGIKCFYGCSLLKNITIPKNLEKIPSMFASYSGLENLDFLKNRNIKEIEPYAFSNCTSFQSITVPDTVKKIGDNCFEYCSNLTSVKLSSSLSELPAQLFLRCAALKAITIPDSVIKIGEKCFEECTVLSSVTLSSNLQEISYRAFYGLGSLNIVNFPSTINLIDSYAFYKTGITKVTLSGAITIKSNAFDYCPNLTSVTFNDVNSETAECILGDSCFENCPKLESIRLPSNLVSIPNYMAYNCSTLKTVTIPQNSKITSIGRYAFYKTGITSIIIPEGVETIADYAFMYSPITSITIPNSVKTIGNYVFENCPELETVQLSDNLENISKSLFYGCSKLTSVNIPSKVSGIGNSAFYKCTSLSTISIPGSVQKIDSNAFSGCTSLRTVNLSEGLLSIGNSAFSGCTSLSSINLPDGLTTIDYYAFNNCPSLISVTLPDSITSINSNGVFNDGVKFVHHHLSLSGAPWGAKTQSIAWVDASSVSCTGTNTLHKVCPYCEKCIRCGHSNFDKYEWEVDSGDYTKLLGDNYIWVSQHLEGTGTAKQTWKVNLPAAISTYYADITVSSGNSDGKGYLYLKNTYYVNGIYNSSKTPKISLQKGENTLTAEYRKESTSTGGDDCIYVSLFPVYVAK